MPAPTNPRRVGDKPNGSGLGAQLDRMAVWEDGVEPDASLWVEIAEYTNHVPAALYYAQKRHEGREYVWEPDDTGVRIWRMK